MRRVWLTGRVEQRWVRVRVEVSGKIPEEQVKRQDTAPFLTIMPEPGVHYTRVQFVNCTKEAAAPVIESYSGLILQ